jgi:hypothetical protein
MNFTLNDRAVNFELKDSKNFQLNTGSISFTLNATQVAANYELSSDDTPVLSSDNTPVETA